MKAGYLSQILSHWWGVRDCVGKCNQPLIHLLSMLRGVSLKPPLNKTEHGKESKAVAL